ncbi:MAG: hypothetical protein GXO39_08875 [Thermotogae bacterium]|nr:hypothetical protein [Thermotogota bacterium]
MTNILVDELGEELGKPRRRPVRRRSARRRPARRRKPVARMRPVRVVLFKTERGPAKVRLIPPKGAPMRPMSVSTQTQNDLTKLLLPVGLVAGGILLLSKMRR